MIKTVEINGKQVPFKATGSTLSRYRAKFNSDLLSDYQKVTASELGGEALEICLRIAYIMAKQADPSIPDDPWDWVDQFEVFPVIDVVPQVITLWSDSMGTLNTPKNV